MSKILSRSNILRKVTPIKNILVDIIDNNQNIKRYARYLTSKTPLESKGLTYDNKIVDQPNLTETLTKELKDTKDTQATGRSAVLIPYMFDKDLLKDEKLLIFVHSPRSLIRRRDGVVIHEFLISVAVNIDYEKVEPNSSERSLEILCEILDEIDDEYVDGVYEQMVGRIRFDIDDDRVTERISDKNFIVTHIVVGVSTSNMRGK